MSPTAAQVLRNNRAPVEMSRESLFQPLLLLFLLVALNGSETNRRQSIQQAESQFQTIQTFRYVRIQSVSKSSPMPFHTCQAPSAGTPTISISHWYLLAQMVASLQVQISNQTHNVMGALSDRGSSLSPSLPKETFHIDVVGQMCRH